MNGEIVYRGALASRLVLVLERVAARIGESRVSLLWLADLVEEDMVFMGRPRLA